MKFQIEHESRGRIRIRAVQKRMTLEQADLFEAWLGQLKGVSQATVHERTCCAVICYQSDRNELITAISRFSYQAKGMDALMPIHSSRELNRTYQEKLVSMTAFKFLRRLYLPAPLNAIYTVCCGIPYVWRAARCVAKRRMKVELLDGVSIGISLVRQDFGTAGSVMFLLRLGELLEEWTRKKSMDDLARCMSLNIDRVWLKTGDEEVLTPISRIQAGDEVCVRVGGMIPLDGVVTEGEAMVNQASLTGESIPVAKRPGSAVYAGTVIEEGEWVLRVTKQSGTGRYDKIVTMIEQSERLKSAVENQASSLADKLVPYTLVGSGLVYLMTRNVTRALSVLMVDFSCALKLSMPLAVLSAMREASTCHATVKGGKYMEALAKADTIVFDKTGTLTYASPVVAKIVTFGGRKEDDMLRLAACLEEHFPHSMANAVVQAAKERGLAHEEMHSQVQYLVAHGIASTVGGKKVIIGSHHFVFEDEGCVIKPEEQEAFDSLPVQYSHLYLAIAGELAAVICIADPLREEAADAVKALKALGIKKTVMLTGDSERTAAAIAAQVGVDEYRSEVLPEDKANFVEAERKAGHAVIMLGDGINDSPALSAADVGIAVNSGAAIAREIADVTIAADDLFELVNLRKLSDALMKRIHSNYRFVIGFNGALIGLGAVGVLQPATSALLHNASTLGVSLRSMTNLLD
ncbi:MULTISPECIES: heavy metal translocating P-type ATPase [unclassified Candidatus Paralachnospira]|uniref:heavy metal translocating P-type ATPase n=1 Tax=unclassified Candidatus Paralachnospira TaxID=3099471 RepID=UPI003F932860